MAQRQAPEPETLTYVIGDVHGCAKLLSTLLQMIEEDIRVTAAQNATLIFVGDYIDRGPDSAQVLRVLHQLNKVNRKQVICLRGNHEEMLLNFLADPLGPSNRWFRHGGRNTMASFGINMPVDPKELKQRDLLDLAAALRSAMGGLMLSWLKGLPLQWHTGNIWVVHAGVDPFRPMEEQDRKVMLWGHPDFNIVERSDSQWVVVGHRVVDHPVKHAGRVHIDTGAVYGGPLTAIRAEPGADIRYLQAFHHG